MSQVRIVTDSIGDVPAALASALEISIVPCQVYLGEEVYQDGRDLSPEEFYARLASSTDVPRTSQPPVGRFVETYERMLAQDPGARIVSIHVAGNLSGTINAAWAAAQTLVDPAKVKVIDSGQVSMGMGWAVVEAARIAQTGASQEEVSRSVQVLLPRLRTAAMIDTLDNLYKGGRISQISATLGTALQIKPLLSIQDGQVSVWGKVRTQSRALKRLIAEVRSWGPLVEMAVLHTGAKELLHELAIALEDRVPPSRMMIIPAGSALTAHLGLGAVGVCALVAAES